MKPDYTPDMKVDGHTMQCQQFTYYKQEHKSCDCQCHGSTSDGKALKMMNGGIA